MRTLRLDRAGCWGDAFGDKMPLSLLELPGRADVTCSSLRSDRWEGSLAMPGVCGAVGVHDFSGILCLQLALSGYSSFRGLHKRTSLCPVPIIRAKKSLFVWVCL